MIKPTNACCGDFSAQYEANSHPAFLALERFVLGCDYGGTSWTTQGQADRISTALRLDKGVKMLELGSGAGWPSIYLAGQSGCDLTLLDIPINALARARDRARDESLDTLKGAVSASAAQLPFVSASFDAIGHSDVLCCLPEKLEMLEECRRVVCSGAYMLFYVIAPAEGLGAEAQAEAIEAGPPFVGMPADYTALLQGTGWRVLQRESVNQEYLQSLQRMTEGLEANSATFEKLMAQGEFAETLERRYSQVSAVERGLLVREMFLVEALDT